MPKLLISIAFVIVFSANTALACEEIPGSNFTANNKRLVTIYAVAAISALLLTSILYFVRHRMGLPAIGLSLVVLFFHPVWYFGGGGGDCGMGFVQFGKYITIVEIGLLAFQIAMWRLRTPQQI